LNAVTERIRADVDPPKVILRANVQQPKVPVDEPDMWLGLLPPRPALVSVRARQVVYKTGQPVEGVPVVCEGWAACVGLLFDGRRQVLSFLMPGDLFSAATVFVGRLNFSVEAVTAVSYARLDREQLVAKIGVEPHLFRAVIDTSIAEKTRSDQLAIDLGQRSASERLARLLLHLKSKVEARGQVSDNCFDMPLRQQHLADATGLTPVHVNRTLRSFRNDGLLELEGGKLKILNEAALQRTADLN
jgi:CRP-like cAMP-binding protein